jgi:ketosteroid isomerase-like protein
MTPETQAFLAEMIPAQLAADRELHNGDPEPRIAQWSHTDPISLFGAKLTSTSWKDVEPAFHQVASWFSGAKSFDIEVIHAEANGDLAVVAAIEHSQAVTDGVVRKYQLRTTHAYRRENGVWKITHRHADFVPEDSAPLFKESQQ